MTRVGSRSWVLGTCALVCGCLGGAHGTRLYDASLPLPSDRVATLSGYVDTVDGRSVAGLEQPLELLPGCHVVVTPSHWGRGGPYGGAVATTPHVSYAIDMDAGSSYLIELVAEPSLENGTTVPARLSARELGRRGRPDRELPPAESASELESCGKKP